MNMQISDISLWGIAVTILMLCGIMGLFSLIDRKMMTRFFRVLIYMGLSLSVVALIIWGVFRLNGWWYGPLWALLVVMGVAYFTIRKARLSLKPFFLPLTLSLLVGVGCGLGVMYLLVKVPHSVLLVAVLTAMCGQLITSVSQSLATYVSSLRHTQEHYQYLLANGASHLEAILPSVRRSLRASTLPSLRTMTAPLLLAPPMFFCGLLLGGASPAASAVVTFVLMLVLLAVSVLTTLLTLVLVDRSLFDASGRFLY